MKPLFSLVFLMSLLLPAWTQTTTFQGRVELGRDLASFQSTPPVKGTLYLLTGAAGAVKTITEEPLVIEVELLQVVWKDEATLSAHRVPLRFVGNHWSGVVVDKKPRQDAEETIYPHRKFQVAALATDQGFEVFAVIQLF